MASVKSPVSFVELLPGRVLGMAAPGVRVDAQEVLRDALDLEFDVGRQADVDTDDADARQIAGQPRRRELRLLQEVYPGLDAQRAGRQHVHVLGDERALLSARGRGEAEQRGEGEDEAGGRRKFR